MNLVTAFILGAAILLSFSAHGNGLGDTRIGPDAVALPATSQAMIFAEKCAMCHRQNGMGTNILARRLPLNQAMLEERTGLTPAFIRIAVRQGIGIMPPISRAEVSDAQLDTIVRHLLQHDQPDTGASR